MCNVISKPWMALLLALVWAGNAVASYAVDANGEIPADDAAGVVQPIAKYETKGRRDPFVKPAAGELRNVMQNVDIEGLRLTGVIRNAQQTIALFASQTGPKFGFLLKNGRLYRENHQTVSGVSGKVVNPEKVVLKQGEKQIVYKLHEH